MQDVPGAGGETLCARQELFPARYPSGPDPAAAAVDSAAGVAEAAAAVPAAAVPVSIQAMTPEHAGAVLAIYQAGIDEGNATFETAAPDWAAFSAAKLPGHRFVAAGALVPARRAMTMLPLHQGQRHHASAAGDAEVLGWVAVSATSARPAYAGVVEHSVYVHPAARGLGIGRMLLDRLIASTEADGIWTIQSGIFPENTASIALHLAAGFRIVGRRERIAQQRGCWRDIVLLERRAPRP